METITNYLYVGISYYKTVQKQFEKADPMVLFLPGGKTQCGRILNPNGIISNDKDYRTKAMGIT